MTADESSLGSTDRHPGEGRSEIGSNDWQRLRELIVGEEAVRLDQLEKTSPPPRGEQVAKVLPEAVARAVSGGPGLAGALETTIEEGLQRSARKNPEALAEAIYPALGPAIRRMIQSLLKDSLEGFNTAMEHSISPSGLRWRIESIRTGRPFSEVVMLHSLEWRVEQVFLIHKETGLLLQEASRVDRAGGPDPDLVSSMLTAIQDFVRDSFAEGEEGDLEQVELSGYRILIAQGPSAVLAAVVSGAPPAELHVELEELVLSLHVEHARAIEEFDGDSMAFAAVGPQLEECLRSQSKERKKSSIGPLILGLAMLGLLVFVGRWWWLEGRRDRAARAMLEAVEGEPGLLLVDWERDGDTLHLTGLADPSARRPSDLLASLGIEDRLQVEGQWRSYLSSEEPVVMARAIEQLQPPQGIELRWNKGSISAVGEASGGWIASARSVAQSLTGRPLVEDGLTNRDAAGMDRLIEALDGQLLPFGLRSTELDRSDPVVAGRLSALSELDESAAAAGRTVRVELAGVIAEEESSSAGLDTRRAGAAWEALGRLQPKALVPIAAPPNPAGARRSPEPGVRLHVRLLPVPEGPR